MAPASPPARSWERPRARRQPRLPIGADLVLRPWHAEDAAGLWIASQDALVQRYSGALLADRPHAAEWIRRAGQDWLEGIGAAWAVSDPGGTVLGSLRFRQTDPAMGIATVGYWLSPEVRGSGVAARALRVATGPAFEQFGWHRIELSHSVENAASCSVARKSGYPAEGVLREAMRYPVDGRWSNEHLHARLTSDPAPD